MLDPDVVIRGDRAAQRTGVTEIRGATAVANAALKYRARVARPALVNGAVGIVVAPLGRLLMVLHCTIKNGKIAEVEAVADSVSLGQIELAILE